MTEQETPKDYPWSELSDDELLKWRIKDLKIKIENSLVEPLIKKFYSELELAGFKYFQPEIYLGDEWFSPEGLSYISVPFYLAHSRLKALEKKIMLEAEGGDSNYFMKLLRHEAGHCFDHAYKISKQKTWQKLFGSHEQDYDPDCYRPKPYSKQYVQNLDNWYAQSHPDEDFAETFAIWLDPESNWKETYSSKKAIKKLIFIDETVKELAQKPIKAEKGYKISSAGKLKSTLERYYANKKRNYAGDYPDFYDEDLLEIFNGDKSLPIKEFSARKFMSKNRKEIVNAVGHWTSEKKYNVNKLTKRLIKRCHVLDLKLGKPNDKTLMEVTAYLTTLVSNYLFTGQFKRTV